MMLLNPTKKNHNKDSIVCHSLILKNIFSLTPNDLFSHNVSIILIKKIFINFFYSKEKLTLYVMLNGSVLYQMKNAGFYLIEYRKNVAQKTLLFKKYNTLPCNRD